jgi:hypothetical protein
MPKTYQVTTNMEMFSKLNDNINLSEFLNVTLELK